MNGFSEPGLIGTPRMLEFIAIHLLRPAFHLNSEGLVEKYQSLGIDRSAPRAREGM
jgi:hypothetical protein